MRLRPLGMKRWQTTRGVDPMLGKEWNCLTLLKSFEIGVGVWVLGTLSKDRARSEERPVNP